MIFDSDWKNKLTHNNLMGVNLLLINIESLKVKSKTLLLNIGIWVFN